MNITLTGADERTKVDDLIRLADLGAEIGFLYTYSPEGRNRYPDLRWTLDACKALSGRCAIHVCGGRARASLLRGNLDYAFADVKRIQVNGHLRHDELEIVCDMYPDHMIITQNKGNDCLLEFDAYANNHAVLVDGSGGRGKLPSQWVRPAIDKLVGFAGGLGPSTLRKELPKIEAVAVGHGPYWIDMEGRLRDKDDWFSMENALQVMGIWWAWSGLSPSGRLGE